MTASLDIFEFVDRSREFLSGYDPDMQSLKYDYGTKTSEIKVKINVPNNSARHAGDIRIPAGGYRIKETITPRFQEVKDATWSKENDEWVLDPEDLPNYDTFLITLEGEVTNSVLDRVVDVDTVEDPMKQEGIHQYWIQARIEDPATFQDIWKDLRIDGVDMTVNVGVQQCFSTAIPDRVVRLFRRTSKTLREMNKGDFRSARREYQLRSGTEEALSMSEGEAAALLRSLASAEKIRDYISVDRPYRRREINSETYEQSILPEEVEVGVETDLTLQQPAAKGYLEFSHDDYTEYLEGEADELLE